MSIDNHKITVFIPTYNRLEMLKNAVLSVLSQGNFVKVHILDNASTDGTQIWLEELQRSEGSRVELTLRNENIGAVENFSEGFEKIDTPYALPLADDDELLPSFLNRALSDLEKNNDLAASIYKAEARENDKIIMLSHDHSILGLMQPEQHLELWSKCHYISWSSILWRTSILRKENVAQAMKSFGLASDAWIQFLIFSKYPINISEKHGAILNVHNNQATRTMGLHSFKDFAEMVDEMNRRLIMNENILPEKKSKIIKNIAQHWNKTLECGLSHSISPPDCNQLKEAMELYFKTLFPICGFDYFPFINLINNIANKYTVTDKHIKQSQGNNLNLILNTDTSFKSDRALLNNVKLLTSGIKNYLINRKSKFDEIDYLNKHSESMLVSKNKVLISGVWLNFPKLHYYVFNFDRDQAKKKSINKYIKNIKITIPSNNNNLPAVVVVLHELSRSGAPILGLELTNFLKNHRSIYIIALKDGPLRKYFEAMGIPVFICANEIEIEETLDIINPVFCIVNSICSCNIVKSLSIFKIPFIVLIHEFACYINNPDLYIQAHSQASAVLYPAKIVLENAIECVSHLKTSNTYVLPQGFIQAPKSIDPAKYAIETDRFHSITKNISFPKPIVVLGAGSIEPRKGVDIFISTAQLLAEKHPELSFQFVWVGKYAWPQVELDYGLYIKQQILKSGLTEIVKFVDPIENLDIAYKSADIFYLCSKFDPLPLVSIEAMNYSIPLVCFESASGIAEYMLSDSRVSNMVVPYLSVHHAANKIKELIINPEMRSKMGNLQKEFTTQKFCMEHYASQILGKIS
jgi:glycosyltransferase involved in cell wall biosynthesis